jgi:fermentation-respiration switch protein FrsA (DUF1100 family)
MGTEVPMRSRSRRLLGILLLYDRSFWRRSWVRCVARYLVLAGYVYVGLLLVLLALEDRFLFAGATFAHSWHEPPARVRELTLPSSGGEHIHAWFYAPEGWEPRRGAILHSHGNGGNLSHLGGLAQRWQEALGRAVLLYDYPGYGKSSGRPSEAGCYAAGEVALRWLLDEQGILANEVLLVGESMGGAIAVELATRYPVRLVVLHGAFTSFPDMAQVRYPWYPCRYLVHNQMDNEAKIGLVRCPVLLSHGTADTVVPFGLGERLFAAAREPKRFVRLEGHGHGPSHSGSYFEAVKSVLAETAP